MISILIWRGLAASFFGSVTVSTPFLKLGGDILGVDRVRDREAAGKIAVAALDPVKALHIAGLFEFALPER